MPAPAISTGDVVMKLRRAFYFKAGVSRVGFAQRAGFLYNRWSAGREISDDVGSQPNDSRGNLRDCSFERHDARITVPHAAERTVEQHQRRAGELRPGCVCAKLCELSRAEYRRRRI